MTGKRKRRELESVILDRYSEHAQFVIEYLDRMRDHQRKCTKCRNIPGVRSEARPCAFMTEFGIFAAISWERIERNNNFEQTSLFEESADPWRVN